MYRSLSAFIAAAALGLPAIAGAAPAASTQSTLLGRAVLLAATFADGPPSGAYVGGPEVNHQPTPFAGQPVQGISGIIPAKGGGWLALADNGYGSIENSADFNLRIYQVDPRFRTPSGGSGQVKVGAHIQLRDPNHQVDFPLVHEWTAERVLTGADFDPESIQRAKDGTLWIGEEFGPSLLHFSAKGVLLEPPFFVPDPDHPGQELRSPQSPHSEESSTLRVMNALRDDAQRHGDAHTPVVSPDSNLLLDSDPTTFEPTRENPPAGSDVAKASSEIFSVASLHAAGFKVVPYTVDDPAVIAKLLKVGVDGLISDRPDLVRQALAQFDANGDGTPGDYLRPDGSVDGDKFDAQAHRGGRDLRPENTLPSMENGLDNLITTLETDNAVTKDGVPVLSHDPYVFPGACRRTDGTPYTSANQVLIHDLTLAELQSQFICDGVIRANTPQTNDSSLSPVAVAFAKAQGLPDPYTIPTAAQLYAFVQFYADYYATGAGKDAPDAAARAAEGARAKLNVETKVNPRTDRDAFGTPYADRTAAPLPFTRAVAKAIEAGGLADRTDVQSFDLQTLRIVYREFPDLATVALFGDFPQFDPTTIDLSDDGTNLQPQGASGSSPWLAGLKWPYRQTAQGNPFRVPGSGGFESLAITPDGKKLVGLLEKPLAGETGVLKAGTFDLRTERWDGRTWNYPLSPQGVSVADLQMTGPTTAVALERDNTTGTTTGFKAIEAVRFGAPGTTLAKTQVADLLAIADPFGLSSRGAQPGDVGLGRTFAFPFVTIESIWPVDRHTVVVANDNNYPFSIGRHVGSGQPDDDEFIALHLRSAIR